MQQTPGRAQSVRSVDRFRRTEERGIDRGADKDFSATFTGECVDFFLVHFSSSSSESISSLLGLESSSTSSLTR